MDMMEGFSKDEVEALARGNPVKGMPTYKKVARPVMLGPVESPTTEDLQNQLAVMSIRMGVVETEFNKLIKQGGKTFVPPPPKDDDNA